MQWNHVKFVRNWESTLDCTSGIVKNCLPTPYFHTILDPWTQMHHYHFIIFLQQGHSNCVNCLRFTPDGQWLATASDDSTIKVR